MAGLMCIGLGSLPSIGAGAAFVVLLPCGWVAVRWMERRLESHPSFLLSTPNHHTTPHHTWSLTLPFFHLQPPHHITPPQGALENLFGN